MFDDAVTDDAVAAGLAGLPSVRTWEEELYRDLHAHPELSREGGDRHCPTPAR